MRLPRLTKSKKSGLPPLKFYNTLSSTVETFEPLGTTVKMYNCGPTVYDRQHIGNLRGPILANVLRRTLEIWDYPVKHVSNITDVGHLTGDNSGDADLGEDRMEIGARKRGLSAQEVAKEITELFFNDLDLVNIDRSQITFTPATQYIPEQIALIKTLEEKGYTYRIGDGIYFDTAKFPGYGKLGNIDLAGLREGARVEENVEKHRAYDFALWKFSKSDESRQQEWPSPWGVGFPGWHIECTAMIFKLLGKQIDIHIGGIDLIPIHHNNEIAQAEAVTGKQFVRYWVHNEFITIEGKKVSKSLGNTVYLQQLVDHGLSPQSLRYWYLTGHYRTPMNFTWEAIEAANTTLGRLARLYYEMPVSTSTPNEEFLKDFYAAIADDLNTAQALARVWDLVKDPNISPGAKRASLFVVDKVLGLGLSDAKKTLRIHVSENVIETEIPTEVTAILERREEARKNKDFAAADDLREKIRELGYEVTDTEEGQKINKKPPQSPITDSGEGITRD
jgi:cysteinyl-tRNA synthetase